MIPSKRTLLLEATAFWEARGGFMDEELEALEGPDRCNGVRAEGTDLSPEATVVNGLRVTVDD